jgi:hypothetical protein
MVLGGLVENNENLVLEVVLKVLSTVVPVEWIVSET